MWYVEKQAIFGKKRGNRFLKSILRDTYCKNEKKKLLVLWLFISVIYICKLVNVKKATEMLPKCKYMIMFVLDSAAMGFKFTHIISTNVILTGPNSTQL